MMQTRSIDDILVGAGERIDSEQQGMSVRLGPDAAATLMQQQRCRVSLTNGVKKLESNSQLASRLVLEYPLLLAEVKRLRGDRQSGVPAKAK